MVPILAILSVVIFLLGDLAIRKALKAIELRKAQKAREEALDSGLKIDYTDEAVSLKRVELDRPKAKILAVDDEEIEILLRERVQCSAEVPVRALGFPSVMEQVLPADELEPRVSLPQRRDHPVHVLYRHGVRLTAYDESSPLIHVVSSGRNGCSRHSLRRRG